MQGISIIHKNIVSQKFGAIWYIPGLTISMWSLKLTPTTYSFNYLLCLFPSYLNHAFYQISATIYLMYPLQIKEFTS